MKANRIPAKDRLARRISLLWERYEESRGPSPTRGNPYYHCKGCGKHDPALSCEGHGLRCPHKGLLKEIDHYKWLAKALGPKAGMA